MYKPLTAFALMMGALLLCSPVNAETSQQITDRFTIVSDVKGCEIDLKQHCADVTKGNNREIMCLIAHEDRLKDECKFGLLESAMSVKMGVAKLDYVAGSCGTERTTLCGNVQAGGGRLLNCIKTNQAKISSTCETALRDTGLWDAYIEPAAGK